ncbi:MAG: hypothetical protein QM770_03210 [Tepidisphaeraceae bacterium]
MNGFNLGDMLTETGQSMRAALASRLVPHNGEAGAGREAVVRNFLSSYLPKRFRVDTGFVFDHRGWCSDQIDIVIAHADLCPVFETAGERRFYPAEAVVAVGQVRTTATSASSWLTALDNLESVKILDRGGAGRSCSVLDGAPLNQEEDHLDQIFTFLFVTGDTLRAETARSLVMDYLSKRDAHLWPNLMFALDSYLMTFCCDDGICPNPMHARGISLQTEREPGETFIRFYLMLAQAIQVTRVSLLPFHSYLAHFKHWNADVIYAATDDPPPLLSAALRR